MTLGLRCSIARMPVLATGPGFHHQHTERGCVFLARHFAVTLTPWGLSSACSASPDSRT